MRTAVAVLATLGLAVLAAACQPPRPDDNGPDAGGGGDGGGDPDGGDDGVPVRSCGAHIAYRPTGLFDSLEVAGAWDWNARAPLTDADGDGVFTADVDVAPGVWPYKIVVTRPGGAVDWLLDTGNPYRAYDGGVENSGARVADCTVPLLEVASHVTTSSGAETHFRLSRASGGAEVTGVHAEVWFEGSQLPLASPPTITGADVAVALAGLAAGKYTLVVTATDAGGATSAAVRVPFWIETEAFDWRDALIYMVMTDRFRDGDPSNNPAPSAGAEAAADFHGGDLRGITAAINDGTFDALGVRALWLSPFVENTTDVEQDHGRGVTAYHGYWPTRARAVDPRLGTDADLEAMVTAAHRHGIRVLMDYVVNHVHADHEYVSAHPSWFRLGCTCGEDNCGWTDHRLDCSFKPYMPDVDWTNREAGEQMIADAMWWLERFDLDGLRVDAVKHVEDLAIVNLATRINETFEGGGTEYFLLGETAMGWAGDDVAANLPEYETISRYVGENALSGQFDFVLYHASAYRVWADDARGMLHLDFWTRQSLAHYPVDAVMTPFVGSHDSERLVSLADLGSGSAIVHHKWADQGLPPAPTDDEPYQRATIALTWMLSVPGAPLLYYGDEYGEHGGADPDNRHMWRAPAQRDARQSAMATRIARAGSLRRELAPLRRGRYVPLTVTEDVLTFARVLGNQAVVVAINRAGTARTVDVDLGAITGVTFGAAVIDRLDAGGRTVAVSGGHVSLDLGARSAMILTP
jgi:glycosidase